MELYQIRDFLALCETLNFARAAEKCHVSQPSLTRAVQKLETELGGLLIRRERRTTHLTELGELMRPMLQAMLTQAERIRARAEQHLNREGDSLRLGFLPSIGPLRFAKFFAQFSADNPGIELQLREAPMSALCDLLFCGQLDAAVVAYVKPIDNRLRYHLLYKERLVCAVPRGHPLEQAHAVQLRDLKGQSFLMRTNCENEDLLLENCRQQGFELRIAYRSGREDWVQAMVSAGCGITIMPEFSRSAPETVVRPLIDPTLVRELSLVTVAGRPHGHPIARLLCALRASKWDNDEAPDLGRCGRNGPMQLLSGTC